MRTFRVWAPRPKRVDLMIGSERRPTVDAGAGHREAEAAAGDGERYAYSLDGGPPLPDPRSRSQPDGVHGASAIVEPWSGWTDGGWRGKDLAASVLYELHVGTFTAEGTFDSAIAQLDHLVDLGVDAIELMPVAEFPGRWGWGYDGVDLYSAYRFYGGPQGLDRLVDACHARGLAVVLDVVYNHFGPDGNYLSRFGPYFTARHRTPWGPGIDYDGPDGRPVRDHVVDNAVTWIRDHHLDGLRLDAIQTITDSSPVHIVAEIAERVHACAEQLGRYPWVIAEIDRIDPVVTLPAGEGGWGCDAQWSDDVHHAIHALLTGETNGYYAAFGGLSQLAEALRKESPRRYIVHSQTHDQVGNRPRGERLAHLAGERRARIASAIVLLSPFVPMLFMGEEWGASSPFLFFTDHDDARLAHLIRDGRRRELAHLGWDAGDVVDPQEPEAFERSKLDVGELEREPHRSTLAWYRSLIALRRSVKIPKEQVDVAFDEREGWMRIVNGALTIAFAIAHDRAVPLDGRSGDLVLASDPRVRRTLAGLELPGGSVGVTLQIDR